MTSETKMIISLPAVTLRGLVGFPKNMISFDAARNVTKSAVKTAMLTSQQIFLITQKDIRTESPNADDLYEIGTVANIRQTLKLPSGDIKVIADGLYRARLVSIKRSGDINIAVCEKLEDVKTKHRAAYLEALVRRIRSEFENYSAFTPNLPPDVLYTVASCDDVGVLSDFIAANIPVVYDDKQFILEQANPVTRGKLTVELLKKETEILSIDRKINSKVKDSMDENQREYYLHEQIKAINEELYGDGSADEIEEYYSKISSLNCNDDVKEKLVRELRKLEKMPQGSQEATVVRNYLDMCIELPWNSYTKEKINIKHSENVLERDFYGMRKVKERILEMIAVYALAPEIKGQIICLVGPPGVGKTSIAKTIAEGMGRRFVRIALGGIHDEAEIRGHRRTYIGAMPGKIISAVKQAGSGNPLILLDEIDKLGNDYKGDPASALLEVLDGEQNVAFTDHFIDMPYDLSRVLFITTANSVETIPAPLLDRLEIIELPSYTREEKFNIAKKHLLKRQLSRHGLTQKNCRITDSALYSLIDYYTREAGVRQLEREIAALCRKAAKKVLDNPETAIKISAQNIEQFCGKHRFKPELILAKDEIGVINGLAWTKVGGEIMQMEVAVLKGTGKLELTGSLGDVMRESAKAAVTYVRSCAEKYGIDPDFYKNRDIHIHATEAAIPKDGPSAGVTMTTALISALSERPVKRDIALTGEISIRGRVLPIGGLNEKSMAAYSGGIKKIFIPYDNLPDLDEVDAKVKENVEFIPVKHVDEIIENALI